MIQNVDIIYKKYSSGDEYKIIKLHNQVFECKINIKLWEWLFMSNPAGKSYIWLAKAKDKLVGHFAAFPVKIKFGKQIIISSKSCLTMTHPEFRRENIFLNLSKLLFNDLKNSNITITFGNPNQNSYYAFTHKAGYKNLFGESGIPYLVKPLNIDNMLKALGKNGMLISFPIHTGIFIINVISKVFNLAFNESQDLQTSTLTIRKVSTFNYRFDILWTRCSKDYQIATIRNKEYLNWRYKKNPRNYIIFTAENDQDLVGYIVLRKINRFNMQLGIIVDIFTVSINNQICHALIRKAIEYFKSENVDAVACLMLKHYFYYSELRKLGFREIPKLIRPRKFYYAIHFNNKNFYTSFSKDPHNWYLTWGDTEDG